MESEEITSAMESLSGWSVEGSQIVKTFSFEDFKKSLDFVNKVGELAEKHEHHPDILINYNKVRLSLTTHSAKGLTEKDFDLAKEIDNLE